jgi:hypothetical protein
MISCQNALKFGIPEFEFWDMTPAQVFRAYVAWRSNEDREASFLMDLGKIVAYNVAALSRQKRLPSISKILSNKKDREFRDKNERQEKLNQMALEHAEMVKRASPGGK